MTKSDSSATPNHDDGPLESLIDEELDRALKEEQEEEEERQRLKLQEQQREAEDEEEGEDEEAEALKKLEIHGMGFLSKFYSRDHLKLEKQFTPKYNPEMFAGYHHITWYVSNAKHSAFYFMMTFGFELFAYKGLETGSREVCSYVLKNGDVCFEFCSPLRDNLSSKPIDYDPTARSINEFLEKHGDGVKDVAFTVRSAKDVYDAAVQNGAQEIVPPAYHRMKTRTDDLGYISLGTIQINGDTHHTLVEESENFKWFLPGYVLIEDYPHMNFLLESTILESLPPINFKRIDHVVQNQNWNSMAKTCEDYAKTLGFHQFWSVDDDVISTEFSALHSMVMASSGDKVKMPVNEPANGRCKSQIEEFLDYYNGPGVQHIALLTDNIIDTVSALKDRGVEFISVPPLYYENLIVRMRNAGGVDWVMTESFEDIKLLSILIDFDENGYLLQLFTKPLVVRPTVFIEIIQRNNFNGFGAGNFKALFETLEALQDERGNLHSSRDANDDSDPLSDTRGRSLSAR